MRVLIHPISARLIKTAFSVHSPATEAYYRSKRLFSTENVNTAANALPVTSDGKNTEDKIKLRSNSEWVTIYDAFYASKLKLLRRISISSSMPCHFSASFRYSG